MSHSFCRDKSVRSLPPQAREPQASAPLARTALLPQGRLVRGGSRSGRGSCGLFLLLPQSSCLLLLLGVALHVGAATLHLEKHPVAGQEGLQSEVGLPLWDHRARALARVCVNVYVCVCLRLQSGLPGPSGLPGATWPSPTLQQRPTGSRFSGITPLLKAARGLHCPGTPGPIRRRGASCDSSYFSLGMAAHPSPIRSQPARYRWRLGLLSYLPHFLQGKVFS